MATAATYRTAFSVNGSVQESLDGISLKANNGDPLPEIGFLRPSTLDMSIEELRKRYEEDGYLWMKGIVDKEKVLRMREKYFQFMRDTDILAEGTNPRDGIFSGKDWREFLLPGALRVFNGMKDEGIFVDKVFQAHVADFYQEFKENATKPMVEFAGRLRQFQDPMLLTRSLLRCNVPGGETTPVHYDQIFLRAGPPTSITGWIPLGDCPIVGGGLMYLENSVSIGKQFESDFTEKARDLSDEERISAFNKNMMAGGFLDRDAAKFGQYWGRKWLVTHYEAGDVVFHDPFMVHASCKNESPNGLIRLSTDLRFVDQAQPFDERWMFEAYQKDDPNIASRQKIPPGPVSRKVLETDAEQPLGVSH